MLTTWAVPVAITGKTSRPASLGESFVRHSKIVDLTARREHLFVGSSTISTGVPVKHECWGFYEREERHMKAENEAPRYRSEAFCEGIGIVGSRQGMDTRKATFVGEPGSEQNPGEMNIQFGDFSEEWIQISEQRSESCHRASGNDA
jgi:hypothetical protein